MRANAQSRAASPARCRARIFHQATAFDFDDLSREGLPGVRVGHSARRSQGDDVMNLSTGATSEPGKIEAYKVSEHARMGTLPRHFGRHMMTVEGRIYDLMHDFACDYQGGCWAFYEISNGGFFMSPPHSRLRLRVETNGYEGEMSGEAAGITVCLFAFSLLSFEYTNEVFARHFHKLRDFALGHAESAEIFAAID
jgi:hypothetical protein